jgi:two-component system, cell cycle response regulator DivK
MRIVYVEDNPANLFLVQRVARMGNHEVIHYGEGQPALDHFKADNPDLVLMDVQLPGMLTGLDVVKKLRADGHKTPIIAVTAYAMSGDREKCLAAGCDGYLAKPLPVGELVELFRRYGAKAAPATPLPAADAVKADVAPSTEATAQPVEPVAAEATPTPAAQPVPDEKPDRSGDETVPSRPTLELKAAESQTKAAEQPTTPVADATPSESKVEADVPKSAVVESSASPTPAVNVEPVQATPAPEKKVDSPTPQHSSTNGTSEKLTVENGK